MQYEGGFWVDFADDIVDSLRMGFLEGKPVIELRLRSRRHLRHRHHRCGFWVDFADEVVDSLRAGFLEGKPVIEVAMGGVRHLFDFYRMFHVDLESGDHRSVA
ncbi:hypothetical protein U1Q18_016452 [Sarracenia purpurea var. burkii]